MGRGLRDLRAPLRIGSQRYPRPHARQSVVEIGIRPPLWKRSRRPATTNTPLDLGMAWTGEWYPYAFGPFLQSHGGDIIDTSANMANGALNGEAGMAFGEWWQSLFGAGPRSGHQPRRSRSRDGLPRRQVRVAMERQLGRSSGAGQVRRRHAFPAGPGFRKRTQDWSRKLAVRHFRNFQEPGRRERLHRIRHSGQISCDVLPMRSA